jgi:hypothetical protein
MPESECPVCFGNQWLTQTPCRHTICLNCLLQLRKDECPSCRGNIWYSLPKTLQNIVTMPNRNRNHRSQSLNIHNHEDFPSLS